MIFQVCKILNKKWQNGDLFHFPTRECLRYVKFLKIRIQNYV